MSARYLASIVGVSLALVAAGCGSDDGDDDAAPTTTVAADGGATTTTLVEVQDGDEDATTTTAAASGDDAPAADADLTGAEICERLPAGPVGVALGVADVSAEPGTSATPQCSYRFTGGDGAETDVTVAALRPGPDLLDRVGAEAFTYVVDLNTAAGGSVTETPIDVGDRSVVLTGDQLHMAVVQLGDRIVTVLVRVEEADVAAVTALAAAAASVLAS